MNNLGILSPIVIIISVAIFLIPISSIFLLKQILCITSKVVLKLALKNLGSVSAKSQYTYKAYYPIVSSFSMIVHKALRELTKTF